MTTAKSAAWIRTRYGVFDVNNPTFDIRDISHALAQVARFNGHTRIFYSVASHSGLVSYLMAAHVGGDPLEGLLHDATEAYLSDVPSPIKAILPDWKALDARVDAALRAHFGLPAVQSAECKTADLLALFIEAYQLIEGSGADFELAAKRPELREWALKILATDPMVDLLSDDLDAVADPNDDSGVLQALYEEMTAVSQEERLALCVEARKENGYAV